MFIGVSAVFSSIFFIKNRFLGYERGFDRLFTLCSAYGTILVYLSVALGSYTTITKIFFEIRLTLGLTGLFVVASSAFASLGIFGYAHVKSNLIVAEVVPFLLLAIGADNIFIFVLEYKRVELELKRKGEFDTWWFLKKCHEIPEKRLKLHTQKF